MCSVAPKLFYVVPDGVCIGWACALWLQRLFYVESKGNVKPFLACGLGGFWLMSRWGLGLFASTVSRSSSLVFGVGGMGGSP